MTRSQLETHTHALLERLHREFDEQHDDNYIDSDGQAHFDRLVAEARVLDFIPVLVYRATRNDILDGLRVESTAREALSR